ncbi:hypothetical protein [Geobacter sp. SVR]|uniref:hypothetical protein n=1 Tax=Geobacter sp. SVR TaxID=2495594 RepID=UPI00143EFC4A|nr:hypothetical protein [Geobacter sp. SVR]BCS52089.1 hypothetical protein GSVR_03970 [Geobacter sp. SVR]GCF86544.1 hypothetical protein GSbR_31440 [Geobacter sp. SVR]
MDRNTIMYILKEIIKLSDNIETKLIAIKNNVSDENSADHEYIENIQSHVEEIRYTIADYKAEIQ